MKIKLAAATALLLASTAAGSAADLAVKARPYVAPAPIYSWTGFYLGVHVGAGWGTTELSLSGASFPDGEGGLISETFGLAFSQNSRSGFLGGVQAGYNWQSGIAVFGIQGDFAGADIKGTNPCLLVLSCTTKSDWLATVSGRVGAVIAERGLIYVKGGAAWLNSTHSASLPNGGTVIPGLVGQELSSREHTNFGWLLGMGVEYAFTPNWTAFIEYNYMEFDRKNHAFLLNPAVTDGDVFTVNADIRNKLSIAKVGVNYKFDWGTPVVARY